MTARKERRINVKTRIVCRRADQPDVAFLHIGQQQILLGFIEPMEFIDEQNRRGLWHFAGRCENIAQLGDVGHDGVDPDETAFGFMRDGFGNAGLATAGRPVKQQ